MPKGSKHHKEKNVFRFQTFHERLAGVNIDVARKLKKLSAVPEDEDTFFGEGLKKWSELNLTLHFTDFRHDVRGEVDSFVQLLHNQDEVINALQKHLMVPDSLALEPLLDLVTQLARDLQGDFYPFFQDFFSTIVKLLTTYHEVDIIEACFTCLAYLIKILWRKMITDMPGTFKLFSPLFGSHHKQHINSFAAESFGFLMRKVRDKDTLFRFLFGVLTDSPQLATGVATLLFQMIKGVKYQFHSSTEEVLSVLFGLLGDSSLHHDQIRDVLTEFVVAVATHTNHEHAQPIVANLTSAINTLHEKLAQSKDDTSKSKHMVGLLTLLRVIIQHKNGQLVDVNSNVIKTLSTLLDAEKPLAVDCVSHALYCCVDLFMASRCAPDYPQRLRLINQIFALPYPRSLLFEIVGMLFEIPFKERDFKPAVELYIHRQCLQINWSQPNETELGDEACYKDVVKLILAWSNTTPKMHIDFTIPMNRHKEKTDHPSFVTWLCSSLDDISVKTLKTEPSYVRAQLHVLSVVRPVENKRAVDLYIKALKTALPLVTESEHSGGVKELIWEIVQGLMKVADKESFVNIIQETIDFSQLFRLDSTSLHLLDCCALFYNTVKDSKKHKGLLTAKHFLKLWPSLKENLWSPYHLVRQHTLDICRHFELRLPVSTGIIMADGQNVFEVCYAAECIGADVQRYRDKLVHLRKLEYPAVQMLVPVGQEDFQEIPLRYLLGVLYVNLRLLWEPITQLIASHANGSSADLFWCVFYPRLEHMANIAEESLKRKPEKDKSQTVKTTGRNRGMIYKSKKGQKDQEEDNEPSMFTLSISEIFQKQNEEVFNSASDRPNHSHMRSLLWQAMTHFSGACEAKSKLLSPLLFRFLENEFYAANPEKLKYISVETKITADPNETPLVEAEEEEEMDHEDTEENIEKDEDENEEMPAEEEEDPKMDVVQPGRGTASVKALIDHITLFSKFRDPRSLALETRLRELYLELLVSTDAAVQKVAWSCLMTYGFKYLTPYQENFSRLLEEKTFRTELTLFGIDSQTTAIQPDHREQLVPVLMRLLYGKMLASTSKGKSSRESKQNMIIRFLGGTKTDELAVFLDYLFAPVSHLLEGDNICEVTKAECESDNLTKIVPLSKQKTLLNCMEMVQKQLGSLVEMDLARIFRVSVVLQAQHVRLMNTVTRVKRRYHSTLRSLRKTSQTFIIDFFSRFVDSYPFSEAEIDAVFCAMVWPRLPKLHHEGLKSLTGLTSLFKVWAQYSRYLPLLSKVLPSDHSIAPLPYFLKLLNAATATKTVTSTILEMIQHLLTLPDFVGTEDTPAICVTDCAPLSEKKAVGFGMRLILPHVTTILDYLRKVVHSFAKKAKKVALPKAELAILSRLSEHVTDKDQSQTIAALLIPFLGRRVCRDSGTEVSVLTAVRHLLGVVDQPLAFVKDLVRLFSVLHTRDSRAALCDLVTSLGRTSGHHVLQTTAQFLEDTNSWDVKHIEEPDYIRRLDGFKAAISFIQKTEIKESDPSEELDRYLCLGLIHNCCFFLATSPDMSLRDYAGLCVAELIAKLAEYGPSSEMYSEIIANNILPLLKLQLKNPKEVARHEFVQVLAVLVKYFPSVPQFSAFTALRDYHDTEGDIFAALTHVQLARRAKALKRLCRHLESRKGSTPVETLVFYLLPLVSAVLREECYAKCSPLRDAAVECLGVICRFLPWRMYSHQLIAYLKQLATDFTHQKLMVKIVVVILDSFHFDLSASWEVKITKEEEQDGATKSPDGEAEEADDSGLEESDSEDVDELVGVETADKLEDTAEAEEESTETEQEKDGESSKVTGVLIERRVRTWQKCDAAQATKIHHDILHGIIPKMNRLLTKKMDREDHHKKSGSGRRHVEDEEILRVPIAMAIVKLLQALPVATLHGALPGILLKVCSFLRSRDTSIRDSSRRTLVHILRCLGARYLKFVLNELGTSLQRGYQRHVLSYTVWTLLNSLQEGKKLQPGDIDSCIPTITKILCEDLFGAVSEEKEVDAITTKLFEAKQNKTFETFALLGHLVSAATLQDIIVPLKQVCDTTFKHDFIRKATEALRRVGVSVVSNEALELETILTLAYGIVTEKISFLHVQKKTTTDAEANEERTRFKTSTFMVPKDPERGGSKPESYVNMNSHVLVEFGLQVLQLVLRKGIVQSSDTKHLQLIDPFVAPIVACLGSKHVPVMTTAVRCIQHMLRLPLPSLKQNIMRVTQILFVLLDKHSSPGSATSDENFMLSQQCFKAMAVLVRDVEYHTLKSRQLKVLLSFVERDVHDFSRRQSAFTLLKAILKRRLTTDEIPEIIQKVEQLSIKSYDGNTRQQCRQVVSAFLMDYPVGPVLRRHLDFYVRQLEYSEESGRQSAIEMLVTLFNVFPVKVLSDYCDVFFVPLASRLVNDDSADCRRQAQLAIKQLLSKLDANQRKDLLDMCCAWMSQPSTPMRKLAVLTTSAFVAVESSGFECHLATLLPILADQTKPHLYLTANIESEPWIPPPISEPDDVPSEEVNDDSLEDADVEVLTPSERVKQLDHLLYNFLTLLTKILRECNVIRNAKHAKMMRDIWENVRAHCEYAHSWVRLAAAQLFGLYLSSWTPKELLDAAQIGLSQSDSHAGKRSKADEAEQETVRDNDEYILHDLEERLHDLCGTFCIQLTLVNDDAELAEQIVKNLVFLAKVLVLKEEQVPFKKLMGILKTPGTKKRTIPSEDGEEMGGVGKLDKTASLTWLMKKLCREAFVEVSKNRKCTVVRSCVFKWIAATALELGNQRIERHLKTMLGPLVREYTDPSSTEESEIKKLTNEVLDLIKKLIGVEKFSTYLTHAQKHFTDRRQARRQGLAAEVVTKPELGAIRKIKKNLNKNKARKRKMLEKKPYKSKKSKLKE